MSKSEEKREAAQKEAEPVKQVYGFPPQDGNDAFSCEASSRAEAEAMYFEAISASKKKSSNE